MLKKKAVAAKILLAGSAIALSGPAQAGEGWYAGIFGGANWADDQHFRISGYGTAGGVAVNPPPDGSVLADISYQDGPMGGLVLGYAANLLRPELELSYRSNDVDGQREFYYGALGVTEGTPTLKSDRFEAYGAMLNLWMEPLGANSRIRPYIGGGAGALQVELHDPAYAEQAIKGDDDLVFAYQAGAGVAFALSSRWEVALDYRWIKSEKGKFDLKPEDQGYTEARYEAQSAMATLRWYFAGEEPAPSPAPPAEAPVDVVPVAEPPASPVAIEPPPPPACQSPEAGQPMDLQGCKSGDTIVLRGVNFDFNKSSLTPNARTLLDQVAEALRARPDIEAEISGHTDSKGSEAYNQQLSVRRAQSVRQYLIDKGIDPVRLTTVGAGESSPVADNETEEGRELNRRVELTVVKSDDPDASAQ